MTAKQQPGDRFVIAGKTYRTVSVNDLSLTMLLDLEDALAELGRPLTVADIKRVGQEIEALPDDERGDHPQMLLMVAIGVWAAKRCAGEDVTFAEAIDVKMTDLRMLPKTADRRAAPANPTKARPVSARAAKPRARPARPASS